METKKKEQKITETPEITAIRNLEKKHEHVETILEQQKEMLMEQEKKIRTTIGVKTRNKKSKEQNENKKKKLGEIWTTYRWINSDDKLDENNKRWEQDLKKYHKLEQDRIEKSLKILQESLKNSIILSVVSQLYQMG